ncbi:hypothetical protein FOA52_016025 [Chlamydomonas sp. UWO 241]|nr:hypothetical protein FOA52_016025 [Chlamydomonas sp. UWO 241]
MSARPYSSSGVAPTIRISESGAIQKGHVRDSIDALAVAMAYTNPAACTVQRHAGATAAATFNAYDVEGRGFLDRGQMQSALSELGVLHGFTTAMIEDVLSQDPASSREQRYRLAEFLAMYERMALTQGKAARSAKRAAKAKAEVPAWAEKSPELKRVFEHYSAGYNAGPGVEMSNQQLTRMCGDIGVTGDGGVLTPAAPDLAFARVKETPNMRKLGFPQFLKALAVLSDESGFDLFSITSAHVGELTSGLAPPGGMLPHVGSGGEPVGAKPGNTSNTSNTSKTSNGLPLVVSPLQRGAAGAGPGGAFARHSMSGSPLRGHMSPGRIDSPSCKHSYDAMRRPSVGGGPSGAPGSPPTVAFKERFTGGAGAGPGTPLGSPSTRPSTSGGVPNSPGGQRQPRLLSSAGSVGVGGASANFAAGSAVVPSAWSSRPNTASLGSGPNGRPMLGGVAFSDDCMDSAVPITKMLAGAWHTLDLETAPPESIPPWLRQLLLRVSTLEAAAATGGGEDLVTRSAGGGFGGGGSDLALRVETLEGSVRHLQSAPLPEKTMATMASQLMLQLRPKAVEAANDAVSRMTADVQAASAAAAAAAAAAARLPANLADRVSACEARLDGHAGDLAAVTARTDEASGG